MIDSTAGNITLSLTKTKKSIVLNRTEQNRMFIDLKSIYKGLLPKQHMKYKTKKLLTIDESLYFLSLFGVICTYVYYFVYLCMLLMMPNFFFITRFIT
jgi:hypothetical protein